MRRLPSLAIGLSSVFLLSACWGQPSDDGSSSSSASGSSLSSVASAAKSSSPASYQGEFKRQADGSYLGAVTLTGYVTKQSVTESDEFYGCGSDCKTYDYVFFNVTDGMTPDLQSFLGGNEGNSYAGGNKIGIGCVSDDGKTIVSEVADAATYTSPRRIGEQDSAVLLRSNPRNLVTITLNRDYEPAGGGAPQCYSHFEYVMVTE